MAKSLHLEFKFAHDLAQALPMLRFQAYVRHGVGK